MGKPSTPQYPTVQAPTVMTGSDAYNQAQNFYSQNYPDLLTAQSTALNNANNPNYYASFQPTSFEQALGNQQFQNIWPNEQAAMMQQQSLSGQAYTPGASQAIGNAYGNLSTGIGEYLNTQANNRATNAIGAGLGISPQNLLSPYAVLATGQSNAQAGLTQNANTQNASASYDNQLANYNQGLAQSVGIGSLAGGAAGFAAGGLPGASIGSGIGSAFGGGGGNMSNSLLASQYLQGGGASSSPFGGMFSGFGGGGSSGGGNGVSLVNNVMGTGSSAGTGIGSSLSGFAGV